MLLSSSVRSLADGVEWPARYAVLEEELIDAKPVGVTKVTTDGGSCSRSAFRAGDGGVVQLAGARRVGLEREHQDVAHEPHVLVDVVRDAVGGTRRVGRATWAANLAGDRPNPPGRSAARRGRGQGLLDALTVAGATWLRRPRASSRMASRTAVGSAVVVAEQAVEAGGPAPARLWWRLHEIVTDHQLALWSDAIDGSQPKRARHGAVADPLGDELVKLPIAPRRRRKDGR